MQLKPERFKNTAEFLNEMRVLDSFTLDPVFFPLLDVVPSKDDIDDAKTTMGRLTITRGEASEVRQQNALLNSGAMSDVENTPSSQNTTGPSVWIVCVSTISRLT